MGSALTSRHPSQPVKAFCGGLHLQLVVRASAASRERRIRVCDVEDTRCVVSDQCPIIFFRRFTRLTGITSSVLARWHVARRIAHCFYLSTSKCSALAAYARHLARAAEFFGKVGRTARDQCIPAP